MADPATWMMIATVASAGSSIYSGFAQKSAMDDQASQLNEQARIAKLEAQEEAKRKDEERTKFIARQKVAFLANGIGLAGTPLAVLSDTYGEFQKEIDAIRRSGNARSNYLQTEARIKEKTGRAALVGGVLDSIGTAGGNYATGKALGIM